MADKRISDLDPASNILDTDLLPIVNGGETRYVTVGDLEDAVSPWEEDPASANIHYVSGNVGIGTNSPSAKLDVKGDVRLPALNVDNTADKVMVLDTNGFVAYRDANTLQDNDADPTNEIQTLSLSGNTITLSNGGGSFTLPSGGAGAGDGLVLDPANNELDVNPGDGIRIVNNQVEVNALDLAGNGLIMNNNNLEVFIGTGLRYTGNQIVANPSDFAGQGLSGVTNAINVLTDNNTIEISPSNQLRIKAQGVDTNELADDSVTLSKIRVGNVTLDRLNQSGASLGDGIVWDGVRWVPGAAAGASTWTEANGDVYRVNGTVGVGTSSPSPAWKLHVTQTEGNGANNGLTSSTLVQSGQISTTTYGIQGVNSNYGGTPTGNLHAGIRAVNDRGLSGGLKVGLLAQINPGIATVDESAAVLAEGRFGGPSNPFGYSGVFREGKFNIGDPFKTTPEHFFHVTSSGRVGINTNSPTATLDINGQARVRDLPIDNNQNEVLVADANGNLRLRDANTIGRTFWLQNNDNIYYNSGNVGIGINNPATSLHIEGVGYESMLINTTGTGQNEDVEYVARNGAGNFLNMGLRSPTSQDRNAAFLTISGNNVARFAIGSEASNAPIDFEVNGITQMKVARNEIRMGLSFVGAPSGQRLLVDGSAAKSAGGTTWATFSDSRLKKEKKELPNMLDKILQLKPRTFKWRKPAQHGGETGPQIGFVAQEVREIFPEWVAGNEKKKGEYLMFNPVGIEAVLVKAIQEQQAQIDELKQQLAGSVS